MNTLSGWLAGELISAPARKNLSIEVPLPAPAGSSPIRKMVTAAGVYCVDQSFTMALNTIIGSYVLAAGHRSKRVLEGFARYFRQAPSPLVKSWLRSARTSGPPAAKAVLRDAVCGWRSTSMAPPTESASGGQLGRLSRADFVTAGSEVRLQLLGIQPVGGRAGTVISDLD
jgi:hypothetical protein